MARAVTQLRQNADATSAIGPPLMAKYQADLAAHRATRSAGLPPLQAAWGTFLQPHPWDLFVTLTFANPVHPEQGRKRFLRWITALERHPARRANGAVVCERGYEHQRRHVIHYHLLLAGVDGIPIFAAIHAWHRIGEGGADIRRYSPGRGGAFYIAKGGDVELSPTWFTAAADNAMNANPAWK